MTAINIVDDNDYKNNNYNESYVKIENFIIKLTQYLSSWTWSWIGNFWVTIQQFTRGGILRRKIENLNIKLTQYLNSWTS